MAGVRDAPGALGRLRQRLQDAGSQLHGVGDLGVQTAVGQGPGIRGLPGAAVLLARRNPVVQPRIADGRRRLPKPAGPGDHGGLQGGGRRTTRRASRGPSPRVDDDTVDPDVTYVQVRAGERRFVLAEARLAAYSRELGEGPERLGTYRGADLLGIRYLPPFP